MQRLLPLFAVLALSSQPALAGVPTPMPTTSILGLAAAGVIAAICLVRRKR